MKIFSVVIPAYNCGAVLVKVLDALKRQTVPADKVEIIVIDDASIDNTSGLIEPFIREGFVKYLRNTERLGSGISRNKGLDASSGDFVMFLDADVVPEQGCLGQHLDFHRRYPQPEAAILGNIVYPPEIKTTPLMRLDDSSQTWQKKMHGRFCEWTSFQTGNMSFKASFLDLRFDENTFARTIGFEDTDYGYRLRKKGLKIIYNDNAIGCHYHFRTPRQYLEKTYRYGKAFRIWLSSADEGLLKETALIIRYLPERGSKISARYFKYLIQRSIINDITINVFLSTAKRLEKLNERASSFLYKRLFNYYFHKGYYEKQA